VDNAAVLLLELLALISWPRERRELFKTAIRIII
jgi:hypothetical protein